MLLSKISAKPSLFQLRETAFSQSVVDGIVAEGIDLAKWNDLLIVPLAEIVAAGNLASDEDREFIIAGDSHSRFAAVKALASAGRLPDAWRAGDDWEIPCKLVTWSDCDRLMLANLCRDDLSPAAEAKGFQIMRARGLDDETIAVRSHKKPEYVRRMLKLNSLAACIRERVGKPADAGGISKDCAIVLATEFENHSVKVQQQQELWNRVLAHAELTPGIIRGIMKKIGPAMKKTSDGDGALFLLPPSVEQAVKDVQSRAKELRRILTAISTLVNSADSEAFESLAEIRACIKSHGPAAVNQLQYEVDSDAASIGKLCLVS